MPTPVLPGRVLLFGGCRKSSEERAKQIKTICIEVETVNEFCYVEDRLNANGGCEATMTTRIRLGG